MSREFASEKTNQESSVIAGRNAVTEALKKGRPIDCIYILKGIERGSMGKIIALAKERGIPIKDAAQQKLDTLCEGVVHQGVAAMAACHDFSTMEDIFAKPAISRHLSLSATTLRTHTIWVPSSVPQKLQVRMALSFQNAAA